MKPGGTEGGTGSFIGGAGLILFGVGLYLLLDSVKVVSGAYGWFSGMGHRGGMGDTTSMGIIFVPFFIGVAALFFDAGKRWAWWLSSLGLAVIIIEIFSRIRFVMVVKTTHLLLILIMIAAGSAFLFRAYLAGKKEPKAPSS